eukprot:1874900-Rhodomonas_salina.3
MGAGDDEDRKPDGLQERPRPDPITLGAIGLGAIAGILEHGTLSVIALSTAQWSHDARCQ